VLLSKNPESSQRLTVKERVDVEREKVMSV